MNHFLLTLFRRVFKPNEVISLAFAQVVGVGAGLAIDFDFFFKIFTLYL